MAQDISEMLGAWYQPDFCDVRPAGAVQEKNERNGHPDHEPNLDPLHQRHD
jgi:hypothetical protein